MHDQTGLNNDWLLEQNSCVAKFLHWFNWKAFYLFFVIKLGIRKSLNTLDECLLLGASYLRLSECFAVLHRMSQHPAYALFLVSAMKRPRLHLRGKLADRSADHGEALP
jgi:hypothetical protein